MSDDYRGAAFLILLVLVGLTLYSQFGPQAQPIRNTRDELPNQRRGGAGVNPHDTGPYTTEAVALAGGLI